jgi:hypothetical protein
MEGEASNLSRPTGEGQAQKQIRNPNADPGKTTHSIKSRSHEVPRALLQSRLPSCISDLGIVRAVGMGAWSGQAALRFNESLQDLTYKAL